MAISVTLHLGALHRYRRQVKAGSPGMKKTLEGWYEIHKKALYDRYKKYSAGGGKWRVLAASTIAKKGHDAILIDKGKILAALGPGKPRGSFVKYDVKKPQITMGYNNTQHSRKKSFAKIAGYHQAGTANMPQRIILVGPNNATKKKMKELADKILGAEAHRFMP